MGNILMKIIFVVPSILIAFVVHEICHGYVAYLFGDPTAKYEGRFSLNPVKHLDPIGAGILLFSVLLTPMAFGWAKPVMVNPYNFKNPRTDMAWVAFAGPLSNFTMAALAGLPLKLGVINNQFLMAFLYVFFSVNIGLALFNLIPIPPLDGSKVLYGILPSDLSYKLMQLERQYAHIIPIVLIFFIISPLSQVILGLPYFFLVKFFTGSLF